MIKKHILHQQLKLQHEAALSKTHTFHPSLYAPSDHYAAVQAKVKVSTVVQEARAELERRQRAQEEARRERDEREARECTHRAKINEEPPMYIKKIADQYKKVKAEKA